MMDIQSPTCYRATTALPRTSSTNTLTLPGHTSPRSDITSQYNYQRSNSFAGNMVIESQPLNNFRPMTPDPHPDMAIKNEQGESTLTDTRQQSLSLPPEGALAPEEQQPPMKKQKLQMSDDENLDYMSVPSYTDAQTDKSDMLQNTNGVKLTEKVIKELMNGSGDVNFNDSSDKHQKMNSTLLEAAFKLGFDKSPPTLSPKTMSDTDLDCASAGSPSVSGERRRRKPNIEDIVRRMKEVETDYYSEDSENEENFERAGMNGEDGMDEVDGDFTMQMPVLPNQIDNLNKNIDKSNPNDFSPNKLTEGNLTENNNIISKNVNGVDLEGKDENRAPSDTKEGDEENKGIPLPASSKPDQPEGENGNPLYSTPTKVNSSGWLRGGFNNFPMFPFQASPPDLPFANFMSPFENKYPAAELEKDYLKCQYCERTFRRQKNLENHIENTHHGKSPVRKKPGEGNDLYFKCSHCPYTTKHQSNLYVHLRIHTGERPYICGACGVQYSQSHSLKSHIINKHDGIMSYYIKEKRNRSPRGIGYMTTQHMPGDSPVFKMPASPMIPPTMPGQMPGAPNSLHLQHSPQQQLQHSPHSHQLGINMHNNMSSVPLSPGMPRSQPPQGSPTGPQQQQQQQQQQMSPQQMQQQHRPPFPPLPHVLPDGMDVAQKSLELAKLGLINFPFYGKPFHCKLSPPFHMNGHGPVSPQYNGLDMQMRQHIDQIMPRNGGQPLTPQQQQQQQQFHKSPLQEIHENKIQDENGAIDLTKKSKEEALDLALSDKKNSCTEDGQNCKNCLHLLKLKMLRMNVVRMLSILVPNLNFEEKGINAEGDSVDDLLRDVIESNIHDEESNE